MKTQPPALRIVIQNWRNKSSLERLGQYFINYYDTDLQGINRDYPNLWEAPYPEAVDTLKEIYHRYEWEI